MTRVRANINSSGLYFDIQTDGIADPPPDVRYNGTEAFLMGPVVES